VSDQASELLYLCDQQDGTLWTATPHPSNPGYLRVRHGYGISSFMQQRHAITSELHLSVPRHDPIKLFRLQLTNTSDRPRSLSLTLYLEWVLGVFREAMAPYIITEYDPETGAILARNPYNTEYPGHVAFLACSEPDTTICADRITFLGRHGDRGRPLALSEPTLNGLIGAGLDPCGAIQCHVTLAAGQRHEIVFALGQSATLDQAQALIHTYCQPANAAIAEQQATTWWAEQIGMLQVTTPQPQLDLLLNGWLLYQTLACRMWARSAFYQSGGAYGFRDQLQDAMALIGILPDLARAQILRAAARQFREGDVQHWWHPPTGRGVRTRFVDDLLWLPLVTDHYIETTQDQHILNEIIPFIEGQPLNADQAEVYATPQLSEESATLYQHCLRAVDLALQRIGPHGLPLIGAGDWNDGMNRVGHAGIGESIWMGWFLHTNLILAARMATQHHDSQRADHYTSRAAQLLSAIEQHGWDGAWYRRAYYDDGTPLGSASGDECQIDSIAQSWAIIAGVADPDRAKQALAAADALLVDRQAGLIKLLTPPFNQTPHNPGYIKGYVPGVRENGGQYTHAALWMIWAYTLQGNGTKAAELLDLINPIRHSQANPDRYLVEPYVIAADVYAIAPHTGRGGWTWYTGSAGWMYRLGIEQILGLRRHGDQLIIAPCIPPDWPGFQAEYRYGQSIYHIHVHNPDHVAASTRTIMLDGVPITGHLQLNDDGLPHHVEVVLS
jgi:cellobiose phosphorylase